MRKPRIYASTGLYHVVSRGVNKQNIYYDESDKEKFLFLLQKYGKKYNIELHDYTLMDNHFHLLIEDPEKNISVFIQTVESVYSRGFNRKYDRVGNLFQSRFLSEPILDDCYYKTVFRYILQNPLKAGITKDLNYKWSSYKLYRTDNKKIKPGIADKYFGGVQQLYRFVNEYTDDECIDMEYRFSERENHAIEKIKRIFKSKSPIIPPELPIQEIKKRIKILRKEGLSNRTISRITGLGSWIVSSA